jgi:hypothetical protein
VASFAQLSFNPFPPAWGKALLAIHTAQKPRRPIRCHAAAMKGAWLRMAALLLVAMPGGCSRGPARVEAPDWDPEGLAETILSQLDKNGDAKIDSAELTAAPGLAAGVRLIDEDKDGQVTSAELTAQFTAYRDQRVGLASTAFRLSYKGRPVPDAAVKFTPEPFLEGVVEPASATTDEDGFFYPHTEGQEHQGVRLGYYRVQVNSPKLKVPAKYAGADSPLGADVSPVEDASSYGTNSVRQLKLVD